MVDVVGVGRGRSISCAQVQNALPQIRPFLDELPFCLGLQPQLLRRRLGSRLLSQLLLACCLCCLGCDLLLLVLHEPRCRAVELAGLAPLAGPRKQAHQPIIVLGLLLRLQHVLAQLLLARCFCLSLLVCTPMTTALISFSSLGACFRFATQSYLLLCLPIFLISVVVTYPAVVRPSGQQSTSCANGSPGLSWCRPVNRLLPCRVLAGLRSVHLVRNRG